jgi:DNA-binding Lrp family transcriptional regulator
MIALDDTDWRLLHLLQADAARSNQALAEAAE